MAFGIALEVSIGLIFVYLLLSLFATALVELIANGLARLRQRTLMQGLYILLESRKHETHPRTGGSLTDRVGRALGLHQGVPWIQPKTPRGRDTTDQALENFSAFLETPSIRTAFLSGNALDPDPQSALKHGMGPSSIAPRQFAQGLLEWAQDKQRQAQSEEAGATSGETAADGDDAISEALTSGAKLSDTRRSEAHVLTTDSLLDSLNYLPDTPFTASIQTAVMTADNKVEDMIGQIEAVYQRAVDRMSGTFKRKVHIWTLWIAISLAVLSNADTITIAERLWTDRTLREAIIDVAGTYADSCVLQGENADARVDCSALDGHAARTENAPLEDPGTPESEPAAHRISTETAPNNPQTGAQPGIETADGVSLEDARERLQRLSEAMSLMPLTGITGMDEDVKRTATRLGGRPGENWDHRDIGPVIGGIAFKMLGLFLTAIALSLGAPFWFDLLKRIMSIRAMGRRDSPEPDASRSSTAAPQSS
ncbi:hypothetical protein [Maricaulis sp.]|uniref:hypothetical protein n=1 Tax=Maricaulis sp. TaxID=1486257 RepID=UPI00261F1F8D|nr:hypothetical protein [Maricaulis sp.]